MFATVPFAGNNGTAKLILIDQTVAGCPAGSSAIMNDTAVIKCFTNQTLVDDQSYLSQATGYTPSGNVVETGNAWFKRLESPIAALDPVFALFIALGIMMFTSLMAGITTGPAVSLCVTFEGWVFYGLNMFTLLDDTRFTPMGPLSPVTGVLTLMTLVTILWLFVEYRRKNK